MRKSRKMTTKQKIEILLGKACLLLIESALLLGFIFAILYIIGIIENFMENHFWLIIPMGLIDFILLIKEVNNSK